MAQKYEENNGSIHDVSDLRRLQEYKRVKLEREAE
jgi:hypothetical protein